jgi:hypothetical protein
MTLALIDRECMTTSLPKLWKLAIEGLLAQGQQGADIGDKLRVRLIGTDIQRGLARIHPGNRPGPLAANLLP